MPQSSQELVESIIESAKSIIDRERHRAPPAPARRDQHAKHHGCLWAYFDVLPQLPPELRVGVFAEPGKRYRAWLRLSNSSPRPQSDAIYDGRGAAIKLLEVEGERSSLSAPDQPATQDFILLNHSAFFAEDLTEMAAIFKWQAQNRWLPWYFIRHFRLRGLWAIARLASKPDSPLDLTYFSQTPSAFGAGSGDPLAVKYRLRPITGIQPTQPTNAERASGDHLQHVLRRQLLPNEQDRRSAQLGTEPERHEALGDAVFAFEVQFRQAAESIDRSDVSWSGQFVQLAVLRIPRQDFDAPERMAFAERMAFSVWNALSVHEPLGELNRARAAVYAAISTYRNQLNQQAQPAPAQERQPAFTQEEWNELRALPPGPVRSPEKLADVLAGLTPKLAALPLRLLASRVGMALPLITLAGVLACVLAFPERLGQPVRIDEPLRALGLSMKSEDLIPPAVPSARFLASRQERYRLEDDPVWLFRYGSMGAEFSAGIPYWIYRVLPHVVPEQFGERKDWSEFGLSGPDDTTFYEDYHGLPRGLVLSETLVTIGNQDLGIHLKRVALNCASCHRGEYRDNEGRSHFVDGMPNLSLDAAAFKRKLTAALASDDFTAQRVLAEIDRQLASDHEARQLRGAPHQLNGFERFVYTWIVQLMQKSAHDKEAKLGWLDRRPLNGPGRLDAFGAFRFESLGFPDTPTAALGTEALTIATVDLPSIWNQGARHRPRHHYDGNTDDGRARNVGAIVGVGGHPLSIRHANVKRVGAWIDNDLPHPSYPFGIDKESAKRGRLVFEKKCSGCHGGYDDRGQLSSLAKCMKEATDNLAHTDAARLNAIDTAFVDKLNGFGERNGLWTARSFSVTQGYLCPPLDGIWARAPYLHNGSVPTLDHLLSGDRPTKFTRGNPAFDTDKGGFVWNEEPSDGRLSFSFDATLPGNRAQGHDSETQLVKDPGQRRDLIQYLYSL